MQNFKHKNQESGQEKSFFKEVKKKDGYSKKSKFNLINHSLSLYKKIFDSATTGMVVCDDSGQCIKANNAIGKFVGGTREDILSQNYQHMKSWEGTSILKTILRAKETKKKQQLEESLELVE